MYTNITEAEWKIMKVLWDQSPLSLKEIVEALKNETTWSNTTIRTLIVRLLEKGLLEADKNSSNFKYYPIVAKEECQLKEAKSFLDTVFEGSVGRLVTAFTKQGKLSEEDREALKKLIDEMEG